MSIKRPRITTRHEINDVLTVKISGPLLKCTEQEIHQTTCIDKREIDYAYKELGARGVLDLFANRLLEADADMEILYNKVRRNK